MQYAGGPSITFYRCFLYDISLSIVLLTACNQFSGFLFVLEVKFSLIRSSLRNTVDATQLLLLFSGTVVLLLVFYCTYIVFCFIVVLFCFKVAMIEFLFLLQCYFI